MWSLEWGEHEALLRRAARFGPVQALLKRPMLYKDLEDVWEAFLELNKGRQAGFDICKIELHEIVEYLSLLLFRGQELIDAVRLIRALDMKAIELFKAKPNANT